MKNNQQLELLSNLEVQTQTELEQLKLAQFPHCQDPEEALVYLDRLKVCYQQLTQILDESRTL